MKKKDLDNCRNVIDALLDYEPILSVDKDNGKFYFKVEKKNFR